MNVTLPIDSIAPQVDIPIHVGMDVHKETISLALAWVDARTGVLEQHDLGSITNNAKSIKKVVKQMGENLNAPLQFVYEAGVCGYAVYRQLRDLSVACDVIAPTMIPKSPGDRVKTDRRDAMALARMNRFGMLTKVWVPSESHEALRSLTRNRCHLKESVSKEKVRIQHFLLTRGKQYEGRSWTQAHRDWMKALDFPASTDHITLRGKLDTLGDLEKRLAECDQDVRSEMGKSPLQSVIDDYMSLRGVNFIVAASLVTELGDVRRFQKAGSLMSYLGLTSTESSSGGKRKTGGITKTGSALLRRLLTESAWNYRYPARDTRYMQQKSAKASEFAKERAWAAQKHLHDKYENLKDNKKHHNVITTAVARELVGYIWDIGCRAMTEIDAKESNQTATQ